MDQESKTLRPCLERDQLQTALDRNRQAANRLFAPPPEGRVEDGPSGVRIYSGNPFPLFNGIYPEAGLSDGHARDWVRGGIAKLRARTLRGICWVKAGVAGEFARQEALAQGASFEGVMQDFAVDVFEFAQEVQPASPSGFEIRPIETGPDLKVWNRIVVDGFGLPDFAADHFVRVFELAHELMRDNLRNFLVRVDGTPIGTGSIFYANGFAGVYNIVIHERWRNQDFAQALLRWIAWRVRKSGYRYAGGAAFDAVMPLYRKAPLELLGRMELYLVEAKRG